MTPSLEKMVAHCMREGKPRSLSCAAAVAASLPENSELRQAWARFERFPASDKRRALRNPLAAARIVAALCHCRRVERGPAWGVVDVGGERAFAVSTGHAWFARSDGGVVKVDPRFVLRAWEIR